MIVLLKYPQWLGYLKGNMKIFLLLISFLVACNTQEEFSNRAILEPKIVYIKVEPSFITLDESNGFDSSLFKVIPVLINGDDIKDCTTFVCFEFNFEFDFSYF